MLLSSDDRDISPCPKSTPPFSISDISKIPRRNTISVTSSMHPLDQGKMGKLRSRKPVGIRATARGKKQEQWLVGRSRLELVDEGFVVVNVKTFLCPEYVEIRRAYGRVSTWDAVFSGSGPVGKTTLESLI